MKESAYLAANYHCNENCRFCPCSKQEKAEKMITPLAELKTAVDFFAGSGIREVTVSGGEPTLHPDLPELARYIQKKGLRVTLLSNGERFSEDGFLQTFLNSIDKENLRIITTLHGTTPEDHEEANQTAGSFQRTIHGLQKLTWAGIRITIKHCITKENYQKLAVFYTDCCNFFPETVDIQLCGIDYCGIPKERLEQEMLAFPVLRPYLEELFDLHIARMETGSRRRLYCINIPLCACDVYYWRFFPARTKKMYGSYKDPRREHPDNVPDNVGIRLENCGDCKAASRCGGTYFTAFDAFGSKIIRPF